MITKMREDWWAQRPEELHHLLDVHTLWFLLWMRTICVCLSEKYRKIFRKIKELLRRNGNNITGLSNMFPAKKNFKGQCDVFTSSY